MPRPRFAFLVAFISSVAMLANSPARAQVADWDGGTGLWNVPGNWNPAVVPSGATFDVLIDNGDVANSVVTLNVTATIGTLTLDTGDTLEFNNSRSLSIAGATLTNNGTIAINGTTSNTSLRFTGATPTISGSGVIGFNDDIQSRITGSGSPMITHGADHTIQGGGSLLANTAGMINNGTILGDGTIPLTIDPDADGFTNNNIVQATSAEGIVLTSGTFTNNSTIEAATGSKVNLTAASLVGGTLASTGTGVINVTSTSSFDAVTLAAGSTVNQNNAATVNVSNGLTNHGTWNNLGTTSVTNMNFIGDQLLGGTGEVVLNNDPQSRITGTTSPVITHDADHTIRGGGSLLANLAGMINNGTILGDGTIPLTIDPDADGFTNNNIVQATSTEGIVLTNGTFTNNSTIEALAGSKVNVTSATLVGGTLASTGTGVFNITSTSSLDAVSLAAGSTVNQNNSATVSVSNGLTNHGTWNNLGTTSATNLNFVGDQLLGGTGEVVLNNDPQSRITGTTSPVITQGADHTIRGGGALLANLAGMINDGTILGDGTIALTIDPDGDGFTNNNILQATSAEGIVLTSGTFTNNSTIEALTGSKVNITAAALVGGTLASTGTGVFNITSTSSLDAVSIAAGSTVNQNNAATVNVSNGLTNHGTWNNLGTTSVTNMNFIGDQLLGGAGEIVLNNDAQSRITGTTSPVITHGADHTIRGGGSLLANLAGMINNGTILGDGTIPLTIDPDADGFTNNGLIQADPGSTVTILSGGTFDNTPGGLLAGDGTINVSAISFVNNGGVAPGTSPGVLNLTGNYAESTTATLFIEIGGTLLGDDYDQFAISGDASLAGTLSVDLLGFLPSPSDTFTILTANSVSGMFSNAASSVTTLEGHTFDVTYNGASVVLGNFSAVPEPGSLALFAMAAVLLACRRRKA